MQDSTNSSPIRRSIVVDGPASAGYHARLDNGPPQRRYRRRLFHVKGGSREASVYANGRERSRPPRIACLTPTRVCTWHRPGAQRRALAYAQYFACPALTRLVGTAKTRELYFLGDIIDSAAAASLGLANRVVEDEALRNQTRTLARRITDGPRVAFWLYKAQFVRRGNRAARRRARN